MWEKDYYTKNYGGYNINMKCRNLQRKFYLYKISYPYIDCDITVYLIYITNLIPYVTPYMQNLRHKVQWLKKITVQNVFLKLVSGGNVQI